MSVNIRKLFKLHCGPGAVYLSSEFKARGEHNTVVICFKIIPEERAFRLDGVLHEGETDDEMTENAVRKIAGIAKNIRETLAKPDGGPGRPAPLIERLLS
jgi:hypothetical protein